MTLRPNSPPTERTLAELVDQVIALEGRLATLPVIEQAKGALMITYGLSADAAFDVLRSHSQDRNIKVREIAAELARIAPGRPSGAPARGGGLDRLLNAITDELRATRTPGSTLRPGTASGSSRA